MKKSISHYISLTALILCLLSACNDFMDTHQKYTEGGEIVYAPKVDSLNFFAGKGRIFGELILKNAPNVRNIKVTWNAGADSLLIPVSPTTGVDTIRFMLPDMPEKAYSFDVRTTDSYGHLSLVTSGSGYSYGENYQNSLRNQNIKEIAGMALGGVISWLAPVENQVGKEVRYTAIDGSSKTIRTSSLSSDIVLPDIARGSTFSYRSLFLPEAGAIDTFYVDWATYGTPFVRIVQFDKSAWKITAFSDASGEGGGVGKIIDGNTTEGYWHSNYDNGAPLPHWAVIDMQSPRNITKIDTYRRSNGDTKTVQYFISDDPDPNSSFWVQIAEGNNWTNHVQTHDVSDVTTNKRYLKIRLPDSNREVHIAVMEVNVFGIE